CPGTTESRAALGAARWAGAAALPSMVAGGGATPRTGTPRIASRIVSDTASIGLWYCHSPAMSNGLSGSATNAAPTSCGVNPMNHAARASSVVPVLPANGRPTFGYAAGAVDQPPHEPATAPYPVTQRAASTAARATAGLTASTHRGEATGFPPKTTGRPSGAVTDRTGNGSHRCPSAAMVPYATAISSGVVSATPRLN